MGSCHDGKIREVAVHPSTFGDGEYVECGVGGDAFYAMPTIKKSCRTITASRVYKSCHGVNVSYLQLQTQGRRASLTYLARGTRALFVCKHHGWVKAWLTHPIFVPLAFLNTGGLYPPCSYQHYIRSDITEGKSLTGEDPPSVTTSTKSGRRTNPFPPWIGEARKWPPPGIHSQSCLYCLCEQYREAQSGVSSV